MFRFWLKRLLSVVHVQVSFSDGDQLHVVVSIGEMVLFDRVIDVIRD